MPRRANIFTAIKHFTFDSLKALIKINSEVLAENLKSPNFLQVAINQAGTPIGIRENRIRRWAKSSYIIKAGLGESGHPLSIANSLVNTKNRLGGEI